MVTSVPSHLKPCCNLWERNLNTYWVKNHSPPTKSPKLKRKLLSLALSQFTLTPYFSLDFKVERHPELDSTGWWLGMRLWTQRGSLGLLEVPSSLLSFLQHSALCLGASLLGPPLQAPLQPWVAITGIKFSSKTGSSQDGEQGSALSAHLTGPEAKEGACLLSLPSPPPSALSFPVSLKRTVPLHPPGPRNRCEWQWGKEGEREGKGYQCLGQRDEPLPCPTSPGIFSPRPLPKPHWPQPLSGVNLS